MHQSHHIDNKVKPQRFNVLIFRDTIQSIIGYQ